MKILEPQRTSGPNVPVNVLKKSGHAPSAAFAPSPVRDSARVADGLICHPQACAYRGQKSFSDLWCLSRLRYLADRESSKPLSIPLRHLLGKYNLLAERNCGIPRALALQHGRIHATERENPTPMAVTRSRLGSPHAGHSASVWGTVYTFWP